MIRPAVLDEELRELLRELVDTTKARSAAVVHEHPGPSNADGSVQHVAGLGQGAFLIVDFVAATDAADDRLLAIEHCARALRACARRWDAERVPVMAVGQSSPAPSRERVRARITAFLQALVNTEHAVNAVVALDGKAVASAQPLDEVHGASIAFTQRRLSVEAGRKQRSHAELVGDDYYAVSFWYDACLIAFFSAPYSVDFVRHRARLVTREIAGLLPLLDDPPPGAATVAPIPE